FNCDARKMGHAEKILPLPRIGCALRREIERESADHPAIMSGNWLEPERVQPLTLHVGSNLVAVTLVLKVGHDNRRTSERCRAKGFLFLRSPEYADEIMKIVGQAGRRAGDEFTVRIEKEDGDARARIGFLCRNRDAHHNGRKRLPLGQRLQDLKLTAL